MPRKQKVHDQAVSFEESTATIPPLTELTCTRDQYKNTFAALRKQVTHDQYWFLAHVKEAMPLSREVGKAVPIPANAIRKYMPNLYESGGLQELIDLGYIERDYFSPEEHKCYYYSPGPKFLEMLQREEQYRLIEQQIVRMSDGKLACSYKHDPRDKQGKQISELNREALKTLKKNIINLDALEKGMRKLEQQARNEKHYRRRKRIQLRAMTIAQYLKSMLRQYHRPHYDSLALWKQHFVWYAVAYKGSNTGRMFEQGGSIQSLPKAFKNLAYYGLGGVSNYDVRSCHLAIISQLCREQGKVLHWTEEYVNNKRAKYDHAANAGIPVDIWKQGIISLFYGATLGKHSEAGVYRWMWNYMHEEDEDTSPERVGEYYDRFVQCAMPYIVESKSWLEMVKTKLIKVHQVFSNGKKCLRNACGTVQPVTLFKNTKEVAAFICQGLESAFINHLMILSKDYAYTIRSLEHDGLVVDGSIPEKAVAKARELSGFHTAVLEESIFELPF